LKDRNTSYSLKIAVEFNSNETPLTKNSNIKLNQIVLKT